MAAANNDFDRIGNLHGWGEGVRNFIIRLPAGLTSAFQRLDRMCRWQYVVISVSRESGYGSSGVWTGFWTAEEPESPQKTRRFSRYRGSPRMPSGPPYDSGPGALARGASIGRYVVLGLVGRGGMGEVYAAYDPELDRKVAVKLLRVK